MGPRGWSQAMARSCGPEGSRERRIRATSPGLEIRGAAQDASPTDSEGLAGTQLDEFLRIDHGIKSKKKRLRAIGAFFYFSILAVTYVPASLPTQYHRPGEA